MGGVAAAAAPGTGALGNLGVNAAARLASSPTPPPFPPTQVQSHFIENVDAVVNYEVQSNKFLAHQGTQLNHICICHILEKNYSQ